MKTLKPLNELLASMSDPFDVDGDLERIVREIACNDCEHTNRPDYLMRLLILIQKAGDAEDRAGFDLITSKAIEYAYSLTKHHDQEQRAYIESLFEPSEIKASPDEMEQSERPDNAVACVWITQDEEGGRDVDIPIPYEKLERGLSVGLVDDEGHAKMVIVLRPGKKQPTAEVFTYVSDNPHKDLSVRLCTEATI